MADTPTESGAAQADAPGDPVFCSVEGANFPASAFSSDPVWGLVHRTEHPHTTMGSFIGGEPGPVFDPPSVDFQP